MVYHAIHNFCVVDMSNFYLDIIKDRLYCEPAHSVQRKAAQTAMYRILNGLTRLVAPILAFTSEEIWKSMPHEAGDDAESVYYNQMPKARETRPDDAFQSKWDTIYRIREDVKKALEIKRVEKTIRASLEAKVTLYCDGELYDFVCAHKDELATVFIVSQVEVVKGGEGAFTGDLEGLSATVSPADGEKCERCWIYSETVGCDHDHPTLCKRCAGVMKLG